MVTQNVSILNCGAIKILLKKYCPSLHNKKFCQKRFELIVQAILIYTQSWGNKEDIKGDKLPIKDDMKARSCSCLSLILTYINNCPFCVELHWHGFGATECKIAISMHNSYF